MEQNIENVLQRRRHGDPIDHNLIRGIILHNIFDPIIPLAVAQRPHFVLETVDEKDAEQNFRFKKRDIPLLARFLRIPNRIRTKSGHIATGIEGICIFLRRLAYPNRLCDLEYIFQRSPPALSEICNYVCKHIYDNFRYVLEDLNRLNWLTRDRLQQYAQAVANKGAAVQNCWGFIDGTARAICRPGIDQEAYYSGHKHFHCTKYQAVVCPDGLTVSLHGAFMGRRHDAGILRESGLYNQLEEKTRFPDGSTFVLYGDQAYGIRELLLCPYPGQGVNQLQQNFNASMSTVRQAVEWSFQKVIAEFAFLDFKKNQKLLLQDVEAMYKTATILTNCHTCLYGSQSGQFFNMPSPTLEQYLEPINDE
ncbi:uncharacterized protein LOC126889496 [Diabrotica virgifera virgifera]|uniref:DDE Tnp4 domain-containing protein n=1 Tax=Diabrotica virgifera virgifera TaxID=50390 RepID=A0ABM5KUC1_DIAVI|nr:uncharacterized protein LOC126889496 [Diabrotica virgifera virgifera]